MITAVLFALAISTAIFVAIGFVCGAKVRVPADMMPLTKGRTARVQSHQEFSASTVAATVSLATVVVAFFELVPVMGLWLLWTAVTTALGLLLFGLCARRIWVKMATYPTRPTLHAYLGTEYGSDNLALIASIFTTAGYLSAFAVELTVGSRFLAELIPGVSPLLVVAFIAAVSFTYTAVGGFRAVIITDRIQMWFIWLLIGTLLLYALSQFAPDMGKASAEISSTLRRTPPLSLNLLPFVLGIAVMNLFTFVSNMGLWQRISGSEKPEIVIAGLWSSVRQSLLSWSLLVICALAAMTLVGSVANENLLVTLMKSFPGSAFGHSIIFLITLGLYGALLSTASTQLIALSHTVYEDVIAPLRKVKLQDRVEAPSETKWSRLILVVGGLVAVVVMEGLRAFGFTVADLAFAVYGAALGLVPPIFLTLFTSRRFTLGLSRAATAAIGLGFVSCWLAAACGRFIGDGNLVFLAPIVSIIVASAALGIGLMMRPLLKAE